MIMGVCNAIEIALGHPISEHVGDRGVFMVKGLYTAATGMMVQRNKMDVVTNNIVNAETSGYKRDTLVTSTFTDVILNRINDPSVSVIGGTPIGGYNYGTRVDEQFTDYTQGSLENTERSTDLAISGDGLFVVDSDVGERYTRSGNFAVDGEGYLVTESGNYVLGKNGRIQVGTTDFAVDGNGTISVDEKEIDTLRLVTFDDLSVLRKQGDNLYYAYGNAQPVDATNATVKQGMQENSNVDIASEMVDMITLYRKYEANQKVVSMTDQSLGLAVNLGKLGG